METSCSHCGFPIREGEHVRSYGTHVAHSSESECLENMRAMIAQVRLESDRIKANYQRMLNECEQENERVTRERDEARSVLALNWKHFMEALQAEVHRHIGIPDHSANEGKP